MSPSDVVAPEQFRADDPEVQKDPYPYYPVLREQRPVLKSKVGNQQCWILSRREDVARAFMDPKTFSSRTTPIRNMLFADEPEHTRLRTMVGHMFARVAIQPIVAPIAAKAEALLDQLAPAGTYDIINDFAGPVTITTIGLVLGIPVLEVERLRDLTRLQMEYVGAIRLGLEPSAEAGGAARQLIALVTDLVHSRNYEDGLVVAKLAELLHAGELTQEECAEYVTMLLIAGHSTTTNLIGNSIYMLTQRPNDLARLRDEEGFVTPFIEEVLRTRPSFHRSIRVTTREVEIAGEIIPSGSVVRLLLASANRDPQFFDEPEAFDPDQKRRMHISFGQGIHTCLGNWLARLEAATALTVFARRVAAVTLDPDRELEPVAGGTFNEFGFEVLPVRLTPVVREPARAEADAV